MKPMPVSAMLWATCAGDSMMCAPSASSTSALPDFDDTERPPCLATRAPAAAATNIDAVEMLNVCAASPPVPTMSTSRSRSGTSTFVANSRITCAAAAISPIVSFLTRSPTVNAAIITGVTSPLMMRRISDSISSGKISRCSIVRCSASWRVIAMADDSRRDLAEPPARQIDAATRLRRCGAGTARQHFPDIRTLRDAVLREVVHRFRKRGMRAQAAGRLLDLASAPSGAGFAGSELAVDLDFLAGETAQDGGAITGWEALLERARECWRSQEHRTRERASPVANRFHESASTSATGELARRLPATLRPARASR